jgi:hypothetical protein
MNAERPALMMCATHERWDSEAPRSGFHSLIEKLFSSVTGAPENGLIVARLNF